MLGRAPGLRVIFVVALLVAALIGQSQRMMPAYDVREHYTKYEYRIAMRDGVRLFTAVYLPKDSSQRYPFLINRTPYGVTPYGVEHYPKRLGPSSEFAKAGYIFVFQDVRGRYLSEGKFVEMRPPIDDKKSREDVDESSDLYDTIEWLLKNVPNNNGNAGIWGISYPGFYTSASIIDSHPALKAASPQAPMTDLFMGDDGYHGGAFMLAANFDFYTSFRPQTNPELPPKASVPFAYGTNSGYEFFLNAGTLENLTKMLAVQALWLDQVRHDTYDDYWKARNLVPHMKNIHCAVLTVGGWFDAEDLEGPFSTYRAIAENNPDISNVLVIGPWAHGGWARGDGTHLGRLDFRSTTAEYYRKGILFPFFERYLKGGPQAKLSQAHVFETGTNVWKQYPSWPPENVQRKTLYFRVHGGLSFDPPEQESPAFDEYVSDPALPVPFLAYPARDVPPEYMVSDQRFAASRADVLAYQTPVLQQDVTIAGPVSPHLFVSTSGTDSDWDVKLIDVYPQDSRESKRDEVKPEDRDTARADDSRPPFRIDGLEQLVRGEPFRGKFRRSFEMPEPFTPGKVEEINFTMPDINHTFRRGHRIMVQVESSWFPLTDRNPQTFINIPDAKPSDFAAATERVYRSQEQASGVVVEVLPGPAGSTLLIR
jgi:uncharacterized protein